MTRANSPPGIETSPLETKSSRQLVTIICPHPPSRIRERGNERHSWVSLKVELYIIGFSRFLLQVGQPTKVMQP